MRKQYLQLKKGVDITDIMFMNPKLVIMLGWVMKFCDDQGIDCQITSIYRPAQDGISVSKTHQQMRAFDLSLRPIHGWTKSKIDLLHDEVFDKLSHLGAISSSTLKPRPVYIHGNAGDSGIHAHFQVKP